MAAGMQILKKMVRRAKDVVHPPRYFMGRVACLGHDVFGFKPRDPNRRMLLINQQKSRVDIFMDVTHGASRTNAALVREFIPRGDVFPLIQQQETVAWLVHREPVEFMLMDSFSELTDQKFVHKREGWSFAAHYSDINHLPAFTDNFDCHGLLPIAAFERAYVAFFEWFDRRHHETPLYYLHFPTTLDSRPEFKTRGTALLLLLSDLQKRFPFVRSLSLPDEQVTRPAGTDNFPYHFGLSVARSLSTAVWKDSYAGEI